MFRFVYADDTRVAGVGKPWGEGWFTDRRRSGFTREYGGGCDGERRGEIGQQGRPFRG